MNRLNGVVIGNATVTQAVLEGVNRKVIKRAVWLAYRDANALANVSLALKAPLVASCLATNLLPEAEGSQLASSYFILTAVR